MNNRKQNNQPLFAEVKHLTIISAQRGALQSYKYYLSQQRRTSPNSFCIFTNILLQNDIMNNFYIIYAIYVIF